MSRSLRKGPYVDVSLYTHSMSDSFSSKFENEKKEKVQIDLKKKQTVTSSKNSESSSEQKGVWNECVWSRGSMILPQFVGKTLKLHTGKSFLTFRIREEMVGHKFGEFGSTRKRVIHKKKTKK